MKRIDTTTAVPDLFGPGKAGFRNGDLAIGQLPTAFNADWPNGVQEEILAVIEAAGLLPSGSSLDQLLKALRTPGAIKNIERFTASASWTPRVPLVWVSGSAGGGGGGAGGGAAGGLFGSGGGGGGAGQPIYRVPLVVTPDIPLALVVGAGGAGSVPDPSGGSAPNASAGGNTSVGGLLTLLAGSGGIGGGSTGSPVPGAPGGVGYPNGSFGQDSSSGNASASGGAGANGPFGTAGGTPRGASGVVGFAAPAGYGFGAGGTGGGGIYVSGTTGGAGAAGLPGLLIIEW